MGRWQRAWTALALMVSIGFSTPVLSHTHIEKSNPDKGAQLEEAPQSVDLWFSGKVAAEWSTIKVTDAAGKRVDLGKVTPGQDPAHVRAELQTLSAGNYAVTWNVVSGDGHRVKGSFTFSVQ